MSTGVRLDDATRKRLTELAAIRDRSPHWLMQEAIVTYLDREERIEREKREDQKEWEDYSLTGRAVDGKQVEAWLGDLAQGKDAKCPK